MTKEKLLEILYSERERLYSKYQMPGWSIWAIIAGIATLIIQIIDLLILNSLDIRYSSGLPLLGFNCVFIINYYRKLLNIKVQHLWIKSNLRIRFHILYILTISIAQFLWFLYSQSDFTQFNGLYKASIVILSIHILIFILCFIATFISFPSPKIPRNCKAIIFPLFILCPSFLLFSFFLNNTNSDRISDFHIGIYSFAILFLLSLLFNGIKEKLEKIDSLIERTLYDETPNTEMIIDELEQITIGLRISKYLIRNEKEVINTILSGFLSCYSEINKINLTKRLSSKTLTTKTINLIEMYNNNLEPILNYWQSAIDISYDKDEKDADKKKIDKIISDLKTLYNFNKDIISNYRNMNDFRNFIQLFDAKYKDLKSKDINYKL